MVRQGTAVVCVLLAAVAIAAGCGGSGTATLDDTDAAAVYAASLGVVVSDATSIERAAASIAASQRSGGQNQNQHQHQLGDGSGVDVDGSGQYHIYCPDGTEVIGAPNGPRQVAQGGTPLEADWEPGGEGDTQRLRIHLHGGSACLVEAPNGQGEMECEGPEGWRFRVRVLEDGGLELRFGQELISVERGTATIRVRVQGHGLWTAERQEDGSLLVVNPGGQPMYTIVVNDDGMLTVTSTNSGHSWVVDPATALPGDSA